MGKASRLKWERRISLASIAAAGAPETPTPKLLDYTIIRVGVPFAIAISGVTLIITSGLFVLGVCLFYVGLVLCAVDLAFQDFVRNRTLTIKIAIAMAYAAATVAVSWLWIFRPAPTLERSRFNIDGPSFGQSVCWLWPPANSALGTRCPECTQSSPFILNSKRI